MTAARRRRRTPGSTSRRAAGSRLGRGRAVAVLGGCGLVLAGCNRASDAGDTAAFCADVEPNVEMIARPVIDSPQAIQAVIDLHRQLGDEAPLSIEADWTALVTNYETAATVNPNDPASVQRMYAQAYATEEAATSVHTWLAEHCGLDLGPITTIVPHGATLPPGQTMPPPAQPTAPAAPGTTAPGTAGPGTTAPPAAAVPATPPAVPATAVPATAVPATG